MFKCLSIPLGFIRMAEIIRLGFIIKNLHFPLGFIKQTYLFRLGFVRKTQLFLVCLKKNAYFCTHVIM